MPPRQGRDSEAESAGEGYAHVVETGVHRPHPFLVSRSRALSLCGGWRSDPGSPMLAVQTPYSKAPQFWTGTLQLSLRKHLFTIQAQRAPWHPPPTPGPPPCNSTTQAWAVPAGQALSLSGLCRAGSPPPSLPPRRKPPPLRQRRPSPTLPSPTGPLRWGWTLRVPGGPRREGSPAWRRFKWQGGGVDCGERSVARTKGGRETRVGGETVRRRGGR